MMCLSHVWGSWCTTKTQIHTQYNEWAGCIFLSIVAGSISHQISLRCVFLRPNMFSLSSLLNTICADGSQWGRNCPCKPVADNSLHCNGAPLLWKHNSVPLWHYHRPGPTCLWSFRSASDALSGHRLWLNDWWGRPGEAAKRNHSAAWLYVF